MKTLGYWLLLCIVALGAAYLGFAYGKHHRDTDEADHEKEASTQPAEETKVIAQVTTVPLIGPSHSGPPRCRQRLSIAWYSPLMLKRPTQRSATVT